MCHIRAKRLADNYMPGPRVPEESAYTRREYYRGGGAAAGGYRSGKLLGVKLLLHVFGEVLHMYFIAFGKGNIGGSSGLD